MPRMYASCLVCLNNKPPQTPHLMSLKHSWALLLLGGSRDTTSERKGNNLKGFTDAYLKAKAKI